MSLYDLFAQEPTALDACRNGVAFHLVERALERFRREGNEARIVTYDDAWRVCRDGSRPVPSLEDAGISSGDITTVVVNLATAALEQEDEDRDAAQLAEFRAFVESVEAAGYSVWGVEAGECGLGWLPHTSERDYTVGERVGVLYHWRDVEGSGPAWAVLFDQGEGRIWLKLRRDAEGGQA